MYAACKFYSNFQCKIAEQLSSRYKIPLTGKSVMQNTRPLWNHRFELSSHFANPTRRTFRLADRIPSSTIAGTYLTDKFRIKLPGMKIQGHPSYREVIFLACAPRVAGTPSKPPSRGLQGKTSFVEGGNVIPDNLSFPCTPLLILPGWWTRRWRASASDPRGRVNYAWGWLWWWVWRRHRPHKTRPPRYMNITMNFWNNKKDILASLEKKIIYCKYIKMRSLNFEILYAGYIKIPLCIFKLEKRF